METCRRTASLFLPGKKFANWQTPVWTLARTPARIRASRAVIVGEGKIDEQTLQGKIAGEIATRARQAGVPCFAIVGTSELDAFGARMLDLQRVLEATDLDAIAAAAASLADVL